MDAESLAGIMRRLDVAERNMSDQARTLTAHNELLKENRERLTFLEEAQQDRRVKDAGEVEREKNMQADIAAMKADINSIKGIGSKALWVFVSSIILAFAAFIIKGGLA